MVFDFVRPFLKHLLLKGESHESCYCNDGCATSGCVCWGWNHQSTPRHTEWGAAESRLCTFIPGLSFYCWDRASFSYSDSRSNGRNCFCPPKRSATRVSGSKHSSWVYHRYCWHSIRSRQCLAGSSGSIENSRAGRKPFPSKSLWICVVSGSGQTWWTSLPCQSRYKVWPASAGYVWESRAKMA